MRKTSTPFVLFTFMLLIAVGASAQIANPAPSPDPSAPVASTSTPSPEMTRDLTAYGQMLGQLQQAAQQTASDLGKLKIDKWKADGSIKQESQSNATSLQRNLTAALPELIQKAQAAPQEFAPSFRLYRNLNVVYDVFALTAENAGAFGPKDQYEPLAADARTLDQIRRQMADRLDWLAGIKDAQVKQLRQQLVAAQQPKPAPPKEEPTPAKKPAKKSSKKAASKSQ
jgi:hypothetical protein